MRCSTSASTKILALGITLSVINVNKEIVHKLLQLPNTLIGLSDAGAHVAQHCDAGLSSYLLSEWVRERGALTIEEGVRRLTSEPAEFLGSAFARTDQGRIRSRPGDLRRGSNPSAPTRMGQ